MTDAALDTRSGLLPGLLREAGALALAYFRDPSRFTVQVKGLQDQASDADRAVEELISGRIAALFPQDAILGEETGSGGALAADGETWDRRDGGAGFLWVIDPIDGTQCFVNAIPVWCVSVALLRNGQTVAGGIFDPNADELFLARAGRGASLNGTPLTCSPAGTLDQGVVGIGFSHRTGTEPALAAIDGLAQAGGMFQRNGSGALMLAYVAAGRLLGYFEAHINAWDCLAGNLLVTEAGGHVSPFLADGGLTGGGPLLAAAPGVAAELGRICAMTGNEGCL
ncbi:inositol monophosphatase family protein [Frigidibacter sp. ROC022]|uniref:inositol monophosphatase family protein n=1 Tax=Frigidibacter sp. ROC022 TaxID=2971796 RepID=UPI00215AF969|nr:inositol monophosphatase [Frigidibacter sp. ROC022]MCR8723906.1 inositol monophosphatase [Frigidibacter sp. ROC022]